MTKRTNPSQEQEINQAAKEVLQTLDRDDHDIFFSLGVAHMYHGAPEGVYYSAPYLEMGQDLLKSIQWELQAALCADCRPKPWVEDLIEGDVRELIVAIVTAMVSTLSVPLAIAIPATALVVKRGVAALCRLPLPETVGEKVKDMLDRHAKSINEKEE